MLQNVSVEIRSEGCCCTSKQFDEGEFGRLAARCSSRKLLLWCYNRLLTLHNPPQQGGNNRERVRGSIKEKRSERKQNSGERRPTEWSPSVTVPNRNGDGRQIVRQTDCEGETVEQWQWQQHLLIDDATLECKERMKLDHSGPQQLHHLTDTV